MERMERNWRSEDWGGEEGGKCAILDLDGWMESVVGD